MIVLEEKTADQRYISYQDGTKEGYAEFSAQLNDVQQKSFDTGTGKWFCGRVDAQRIADKLNNPGVGDDMKFKPYGYQRQAIAFCRNNGYGIIRLPCGAGRIQYH